MGIGFVIFILTTFAILSRANGRIMSIVDGYSDDFAELDYPDNGCIDGPCGGSSSSLYRAKKRTTDEHRQQLATRSYNIADSTSQWQPVCGCVTHYKLVNLGEGHYPRYMTIAKCKTKTCPSKFHQCKYYDYRVNVLVKRGINSILKPDDEFDVRDVEELTLPESLRDNWQLVSMSVPVACAAVERS